MVSTCNLCLSRLSYQRESLTNPQGSGPNRRRFEESDFIQGSASRLRVESHLLAFALLGIGRNETTYRRSFHLKMPTYRVHSKGFQLYSRLFRQCRSRRNDELYVVDIRECTIVDNLPIRQYILSCAKSSPSTAY